MRFKKAAMMVAIVGELAACSGGGHSPAPPATTTTSTSLPPPVIVDKTVNTGGFLVHIATAQELRGFVKLVTDVTNTLPVPHEFNPTFTLTASGGSYDGVAAKTPTIAADASVPVELDIGVDPAVDITKDARVTFGNSTKNQAWVDLRTGQTQGLLDQSITPPPPLVAGQETFTFTAASLSAYRYDGTELDSGARELVLTTSVDNHDPRYSFAVDSAAFRFLQGTETLNSGVVRVVSVNPGGSTTGARVYADISSYQSGAVVSVTAIGIDASQANVAQSTKLSLP